MGHEDSASTCGQREGDQVRQEVTGKVSFALVQRCGDLSADLLRQLGTHHGGNALGRLLAHLKHKHEANMQGQRKLDPFCDSGIIDFYIIFIKRYETPISYHSYL